MGLKFSFLFLFALAISFLFSSDFEEIYYKADEMNVTFNNNGEMEKVTLKGNVEIIFRDMHFFCDRAEVEWIKREIICPGKIRLETNYGNFEGEGMRYSFVDDYGLILNADFSSPPFYGKGQEIRKQGNAIIIKDGYITTCNLSSPHYRLNAEKILYVKNNYFSVERLKLTLGKNFNIFYFPKLKYYIKDKQSSFFASTKYKTRIGRVLEIKSFQKKKNWNFNESLFVGNKGAGIKFTTGSKPDNFEFKTAGFKKYGEDKFRQGFVVSYKKNYEISDVWGNIIFDWRWMYDNHFFNDFFEGKYLEKSKTYNYFSTTFSTKNTFYNLNIRENAREPILNIEKLPEIEIFSPLKPVLSLPLFFTHNFSITNFNFNDNEILRIYESVAFKGKKEFDYFCFSPFISFSGFDYRDSSEDKFNYNTEVGLKMSTVLVKKNNSNFSIFTPSLSIFNRFTKLKPEQLPVLSLYEERKNGKFIGIDLDWNFFKNSENSGNIFVSGVYDINRKKLGTTFLDYELKITDSISLFGNNRIDASKGVYEFGVNDVVYEKGNVKYSFGTRYQEEEDIFGFETWFEKRLNKNWKIRLSLYYDFEENNIPIQSYEIWRNLHCLTLDFKISKDKENVSFYVILFPTVFLEKDTWKERYYKWR